MVEGRLLRQVNVATGTVSTLNLPTGTESSEEQIASTYSNFQGVAVDAAGAIYVADDGGAVIRKYSPTGVMSILAGEVRKRYFADGSRAIAHFTGLAGIAVNAAGLVYIVDPYKHVLREISSTGSVRTIAGVFDRMGHTDGIGAMATFAIPRGVAADATGTLYVADEFNDSIRKVTPKGAVTTLAGGPN